jgi:hypothetical protein
MILGVSHVVLGSTESARDRAVFEQAGWQVRFGEYGMPVFEGKKPFLSTKSAELSLVFLNAPGCAGLELVEYASPPMSGIQAPLQIVLPAAGLAPKALAERPSPLPGVLEIDIEGLTSPLWVCAAPPRPNLVIHHVTDLDAALRFWGDGLGFRRAKKSTLPAAAVLLEFPGLVPQWQASLLLLPGQARAAPPLLDGPGFRVLSMVSTQLERDRIRLFERGGAISSTGTMEECIGGKNMHLDLVQGPDGVMVELFQTVA